MNLTGKLSAVQGMSASLSSNAIIHLQTKTATPSNVSQNIVADAGFAGLSAVTVNPIPQNYGLITYDGSTITVS